jgi:hypothetical protein
LKSIASFYYLIIFHGIELQRIFIFLPFIFVNFEQKPPIPRKWVGILFSESPGLIEFESSQSFNPKLWFMQIADFRDRGELNPEEFSIGLQKGFSQVKGKDIGQFPGSSVLEPTASQELVGSAH